MQSIPNSNIETTSQLLSKASNSRESDNSRDKWKEVKMIMRKWSEKNGSPCYRRESVKSNFLQITLLATRAIHHAMENVLDDMRRM